MRPLLDRMKRGKSGQWGLAYLAAAVGTVGLMDALADPLHLSVAVQQRVLIVLLFGFPLTLVLASFHGEKGRQRVSISETLLVAAIVLGGSISAYLLPPEAGAGVDTLMRREGMLIGVLPFDYFGPDPEGESLADAMTNELAVRLSRLDGIQVRSARSMARFRGTDLDVTEIAEEISASHILESSIRESGEQLRVTVQLTDATTGFSQWSEAFDGISSDLFSLIEDMAAQVTDAMDLHLSQSEAEALRAQYTQNAEAWNAFYRGWGFLESAHAEADYAAAKLTRAEQYFETALRLDSLYAPALAGMSLVQGYMYYGGADRSPERRVKAEELAQKALGIDYLLPEAHIALGAARSNERDHLAAAAQYEEALRLDDDNAMAWCLLAYVCNVQNPQDFVRAEDAARQSLARDPTWFLSYHQLGLALQGQGRYDEAEVALKDGIAVNSEYRPTYTVLGSVQLGLGKYEEALATLEKAASLRETSTVLVNLGAAQAMTGRLENALVSVERALARGFSNFDAIEGSPYYVTLRDDPRFVALLDEYREPR